jgi:Tol biopolymer transport system component
MSLAPGTRIGPYEIQSLIGSGGMGEVYHARDTRLKRSVAIKVLPASLAGEPDRLARFEREAQSLAALSHPHIASVYGFEDLGTGHALVMELVEGPTLADRVASGPVAVPEALSIARQMADALEAAHEKNIVHRDLKPANVKLTTEGQVKVLDFGLAKALDPSGAPGSVTESPTLTARATQMGMVLGTAAYMAPEQARGKPVDRRADVWAFGCVVYELITARRAFEGEETTAVLARVIERDPDWAALPATTTPSLRHLLERCLTKDPKARLRDIGEARIALDDMIAGRAAASGTGVPIARLAVHDRPARRLPWIVAGMTEAVALAALVWPRGGATARATGSGPPTRVELRLPTDVEFFSRPSISPDATRVAFVGVREGIRQVYVRDLRQWDTSPVPGTDGAQFVDFSPAGDAAVVVFTDGRVKRLTLTSNALDDLTPGADILGGAHWASDGAIYFGAVTRLVRVPSAGGAVAELTAVDHASGETQLGWPVATPDAQWVLFTSWRAGSATRIEAVPARGGTRQVVSEAASYVLAVTPDRILFQREGGLFVAPFDAASPRLTGAPIRLSEEFHTNPDGSPAVSLSATGTLFFGARGLFNGRLVWVSEDGIERVINAPPRGFQNPRVSPDGRTIAFSELGSIWTLDVDRGAVTRVFEGRNGLTGFPVWTHDGSRLIFRTADGVYTHRADGEGQPALIKGTSRIDYPASVSPDGRTLVSLRINPQTGGDLLLHPLAGGEPRVLVATRAYEGGPQVSPDGKWIAYVSNETGRMEVYLRPIDGPDRRWPVSTSGGLHPLWSRDGRRIYYRAGQQLRAVDLETTPEVRLGAVKTLFERRYSFGPNLTVPNFSISRDGRDLLLVREESGSGHLSLILNWLQNVGR